MYIFSVACGIQIQLVLDLINSVLVHEFSISAISRRSQMARQRSKFKLGWFLTGVMTHGVMEDSYWNDGESSLEWWSTITGMMEYHHWNDGGSSLEWWRIITGMTEYRHWNDGGQPPEWRRTVTGMMEYRYWNDGGSSLAWWRIITGVMEDSHWSDT